MTVRRNPQDHIPQIVRGALQRRAKYHGKNPGADYLTTDECLAEVLRGITEDLPENDDERFIDLVAQSIEGVEQRIGLAGAA